jgi:DNA-binding transcriptional LysR family regulator
VLQEQEISINVRLSSNHLESIRMMVEIGLGWSVLPETLGSENLQSIFTGRISFIRKLGVVTHKQRTLTKAAELLLARIQ